MTVLRSLLLPSLVLGLALVAPATAAAEPACTDTWTGPSEGEWSTASDWSSASVPTSSSVACIGAGKNVKVSAGSDHAAVLSDAGTLTVSGGSLELSSGSEASSLHTLSMSGGALKGGAEVDVAGAFTATGGSLEGSSVFALGKEATGVVEGSPGLALVGRRLSVEGKLTVKGTSGRIIGEEGASLTNSGALILDGEGSGNGLLSGSKGERPALTNTSTGTIEKGEAKASSTIEFSIDNEGTVSTTSGLLLFTGGGSSGREHVETWSSYPGQIVFAKEVFSLGARTSLSGSLELIEGARASAGSLNGEGGNIIAVDGTFELTSSATASTITMLDVEAGAITIAAGDKISGKIIKTFGGSLTIGANVEVNFKEVIMYGGTFSTGAEGHLSNNEFIQLNGNASIGADSSVTGITFLDVEHGKLAIGYGSNVAASQTFVHTAGELELESGVTLVAKDLFLEGVLSGAGKLETGFLSWPSGTMSGIGTTEAKEGYIGSSGKEISLLEHRLVISEFGTLENGALGMSNGSVFENRGVFFASSEAKEFGAQVHEAAGSTTPPKFINSGELTKLGEGTTEITVPFENHGLVHEHQGTLLITNGSAGARELQYGQTNVSAFEQRRAACGEPVNCVTGNYYESQTDLAVGGRGVGLDLTRTYNSQAAAEGVHGPFGYGWSNSFSDHLVVESASKKATLVQANGSSVPFTEGTGGAYTAPAWSPDTLSGSAEAGYTVTYADQTKYKFAGSSGRLESVTDRNGNATTLSYGTGGRLESITDPASRKITLTYNSEGLVESAKDPMGHTVKYTYEGGNLKSVTEPGETSARWQFKYDGSHQITEMIDGRGGKTTNEYNSAHEVVVQTDPLGHKLKWEYLGFVTRVTNKATGAITAYAFNGLDQLALVVRGSESSSETRESFTYNEAGETLTRTDGNNHTTKYTYDSAGNRTSETDPLGDETKWTYDSTHDVETTTTPNGETTTIERDSHGNAIKVSRPAPGSTTQVTKYKYDSHGDLESVTDPLERTTKYEYDSYGDRTAETDPEGHKRTWAYNEDSQETSMVSPNGHVSGAKESKFTTTIERDAQGRPIKVIAPLKHETTYKYDPNGNLESVTDPEGNTTTYTYDADNEPTKVKEPNGTTTETEYDGAGQVSAQIDGNKHKTEYKRNPLEEVTEVIDPLGRKTTKEYDSAGNLIKLIDAEKRTTTYTYDAANRLKEVSYSDGKTPTVKYEYDKDGDRTKMIDGTGTTTYTYDQLDRLTKVEAEGTHSATTAYEYDLANEQRKITYPNGKSVEQVFWADGNLKTVEDWLGHTTKFAYDADSNLTSTTFPSGTSNEDTYAYDESDAMSEVKMVKGSETLASLVYTRNKDGGVTKATTKGLPGEEKPAFSYDENSRLTKGAGVTYKYDEANNPTTIGKTTYSYNNADELEYGAEKVFTAGYSYNEVGERTEARVTGVPTTTYAYDQAGNLTEVSRPKEGSSAAIEDTYAYNGEGLRTSQDISGTTTYLTWDPTGSLPLILNDGTNSYVYGPGGLPVEQITGETVLYLHHDQQGSTRLLTNSSGASVGTTTYDAYGNKLGSTGTSTTPLGYDGQYTSSDTGLVYLRARVYDPATAQFLSVDPLTETTKQRYTYVGDDPMNRADHTGECGVASVSEALESLNPLSSQNCAYEGTKTIIEATGLDASTIATATGILGVALTGTPLGPAFDLVSAAASAYAAGEDAKNGNELGAAIDGLGAIFGGVGAAEHALAGLESIVPKLGGESQATATREIAQQLDKLGYGALAASVICG